MKHLFFIVLLLSSLLACNQNKHEQTAQSHISPLLAQLEKADSALKSGSFEQILNLEPEVTDHYSWFQTNYKDTNNRSFWIKQLSDLQYVKRRIDKSRPELSKFRESIDFSRSQLNNLQEAYVKKELDSNAFFTYLVDEENEVSLLSGQLFAKIEDVRLATAIWKDLKPQLDSTRAHYSKEF